MKRILFITILLILAHSFSFAYDSDSLQAIPQDTTLSEPIDSSENSIGYYLKGGAGIIANGGLHEWSEEFNLGPAFNFGIELPFSASHVFSCEILIHSWIANSNSGFSSEYDKKEYINLGNDYYSQLSLSTALKFYFFENKTKLRTSIHIGLLLLSTNRSQFGFEFGIGLNYAINEKSFLNLSYNSNWVGITGGSTIGLVPSLLMLNYCLKFNW